MKVFIVLSLFFPGESYAERIKEIEVGTWENCRAVARELRASYKAPEGFQYVTHCYDAEAPSTASQTWMLQNYDKDVTRARRSNEVE